VDQQKRFERWRLRLPKSAADLVLVTIEEIVPVFLGQKFGWYPDYAAGSAFAVGPNCIPLQRRTGENWPTVEISFDKRHRPLLGITFATLPEFCKRQTKEGTEKISRFEANVVEGPAFFHLCKGHRKNFDCNFGYPWVSLAPKQKIRKEIDTLKSILPWLVDLFDDGIPQTWLVAPAGYVHPHAFLSPASNTFRRSG